MSNKESFEPGVFHYNLGTVLFKEGEFSASRYHLEKALSKGFYNSDIEHNLFAVKAKLNTEILEKPVSSEGMIVQHLANTSIDIVFFVALTTTLILFFFKKHFHQFLLALLLLLSFLPFLSKIYIENSLIKAVSLTKIDIKEGPSDIFEKSSELPEGIRVIMSKQKGEWFYIRYPSQFSGWVKRERLGIL